MSDKCAACGQSKADHHPETGVCPGITMQLPIGQTCADCFHFKRTCEWLLGRNGTETSCDWFPIKFVPISKPPGRIGPWERPE
jgi:hypothetical protein